MPVVIGVGGGGGLYDHIGDFNRAMLVHGQQAKPHREIKSGDEIEISRPLGRKQRIVVYAVADKHIARKDARALYEDLTPPPTAEEIEQRRIERLARAFMRPQSAGSPDKRERRQLRKMKEGKG